MAEIMGDGLMVDSTEEPIAQQPEHGHECYRLIRGGRCTTRPGQEA